MLRLRAESRRLSANFRSTGPQQQNTDDYNCPVDTANDHFPLIGGLQMLTTVYRFGVWNGVQPQLLFVLFSALVMFQSSDWLRRLGVLHQLKGAHSLF